MELMFTWWRMVKILIVSPCRNKGKNMDRCISKVVMQSIKESDYELIVSDSPKDNSAQIVDSLGTKVVKHKKDYDDTCLEGFKVSLIFISMLLIGKRD